MAQYNGYNFFNPEHFGINPDSLELDLPCTRQCVPGFRATVVDGVRVMYALCHPHQIYMDGNRYLWTVHVMDCINSRRTDHDKFRMLVATQQESMLETELEACIYCSLLLRPGQLEEHEVDHDRGRYVRLFNLLKIVFLTPFCHYPFPTFSPSVRAFYSWLW